jgi:HAD superfamily hydrolase (TIGR01509 family)
VIGEPPLRRLVLDAGGVLFAERFRPFLLELARTYGHDPDQFVSYYNAGPRGRLWRGEYGVDEFWVEIAQALGRPELAAELDAQAAPSLSQALPALSELASWSQQAELWVLSNHRHEWLRPLLEEAGALEHIDRLIISSEVRAMKPEPGIYRSIVEGAPEAVLYVDDKAENLEAARALGAETLLADAEGHWQANVGRWLQV